MPIASSARPATDVVALVVSFAITLLVQIALVPLLLQALGAERFAAFQIIVSLMVWFSLGSLGLDRALKNFICAARAEGISDQPWRQAASRLGAMALIGFVLLFALVSWPLAQQLLANFGFQPSVWSAFLIAGCLMLLHGVGNVGREALFADLRGRHVSWLQTATMVLALCLLALLYWLRQRIGSDWLLLAGLLAWLVPHALSGMLALRMARLPAPRLNSPASAQERLLAAPAARFALVAFASNCLYASDYIVLSQVSQPDDVLLYAVCMRFVNVFVMFYAGFLSLAWPRWNEQMARGQGHLVQRKVLAMALSWSAAGLLLMVMLAPFFQDICRYWLREPEFAVPESAVYLVGGLIFLRAWTETFATALMAANAVGRLIVVTVVQSAITILAQLHFYQHWQVNGMIFGFMAGFICCTAWALPFTFFTRLGKQAPVLDHGAKG